MKTIWLLEWKTEWEDGHGYDTNHRAFKSENAGLRAGLKLLRARWPDESKEEQKITRNIFCHQRDNKEYYCAGVLLKPIKLS